MMVLHGKELTVKTKKCRWKAGIGSTLKYGLSTTIQTKTVARKLQICVSKRLREIADKEEEDGSKGAIERGKWEYKNKDENEETNSDERGEKRCDVKY